MEAVQFQPVGEIYGAIEDMVVLLRLDKNEAVT
jgi:hypothetical protein